MSLKIIELYGSPGSGKSRNAAEILKLLTDAGVNTFWVHEYVKFHAIRGIQLRPADQLFVAGNQFYNESACYSCPPKYDVVVTDSPVPLAGFYAYHYSGQNREMLSLTKLLRDWLDTSDAEYNIDRIRIRVPLQERYFKPEGRYEKTFRDAQFADEVMTEWLEKHLGYHYTNLHADQATADVELKTLVNELSIYSHHAK